jgi:hypothetical protein
MIQRGRRNLSAIRDLVAQIELTSSSFACVLLVRALGYRLQVQRGMIELDRPSGRVCFSSVDAFQRALLREAYRLIGRGRSGQ